MSFEKEFTEILEKHLEKSSRYIFKELEDLLGIPEEKLIDIFNEDSVNFLQRLVANINEYF